MDASAWIPKIKVQLIPTAKENVGRPNIKEMATATTRTTTAAAISMVVIAASNPSKGAKSSRNTAKNASAWIPNIKHHHVWASAEMLKQKKTAFATTTTTIVGVNLMGAIAVPNPSRKRSTKKNAKNVCAWILKTKQYAIKRRISAGRPNIKEMATAMTRTTTAAAISMVVIAASNPSKGAKSSTNTASSANALIRRISRFSTILFFM